MKLAKILLYDKRELKQIYDSKIDPDINPIIVEMRVIGVGFDHYAAFEKVYIYQSRAYLSGHVKTNVIPPVKQIIDADRDFDALDNAIGKFVDYCRDVKLKLQELEVEQRR